MSPLPPHVREEMLSAEYWVQLLEDTPAKPDDPRDTRAGSWSASACNQALLTESNHLTDIAGWVERRLDHGVDVNLAEVGGVHLPAPDSRDLYDSEGRPLDSSFWRTVQENAQPAVEPAPLQPGFAVRRADLRRWPTDVPAFRTPTDREFDQFQETALHTFEPLLAAGQSRDGAWRYVISQTYRGWVRNADVALAASWEEWLTFARPARVLVIARLGVETQAQPYDPAVSRRPVEFAAWLPLAHPSPVELVESEAGDDQTLSAGPANPHREARAAADCGWRDDPPEEPLGNQSPVRNWRVWWPIRSADGMLQVRPAFIRSQPGVHEGPLPFSRANVLRSAFELLGERYGWGDRLGCHDCSSFVMDVYRTVGVQLPRDAGAQENAFREGTPNRILFPPAAAADERRRILGRLSPGDPVYQPGHTMLYLGRSNGRHFVIHDFSGYAVEVDGELRRVHVNEVMVSSLETLFEPGRSFLDALTGALNLFAGRG